MAFTKSRATWGYLIILLSLALTMGFVAHFSAPRENQTVRVPVALADWSLFFTQLTVIIIAARVLGSLAARSSQPRVIGEMIAGILLGPSVFGWLSPDWSKALFPTASFGRLQVISQIGLVLFMFSIGLQSASRSQKIKTSYLAFVAHASIVLPLIFGALFSIFIFETSAGPAADLFSFALFVGVAFGVTAFPVLARILEEFSLTSSYVGTLAITCAAVDDVTAWLLLALITAIANSHAGVGAFVTTFAGTLGYLAIMKWIIRPWILKTKSKRVAMVLLLLLTSVTYCETIGVHALFGAFFSGVILSSHSVLKDWINESLGEFHRYIFLPVFFALSGLKTSIGSLASWNDAALTVVLIFIGIAGKLGGGYLAARFVSIDRRTSLALGVLINTRGLMGLVILNIGMDMQLINEKLFTQMVLMALVTTLMTGPLLRLLDLNRLRTNG